MADPTRRPRAGFRRFLTHLAERSELLEDWGHPVGHDCGDYEFDALMAGGASRGCAIGGDFRGILTHRVAPVSEPPRRPLGPGRICALVGLMEFDEDGWPIQRDASALPLPRSDQLAYTVAQAAQVIGLSEQALRYIIGMGELKVRRTRTDLRTGKPAGRMIVLRSDLEEWLRGLPDPRDPSWR